MKILKGFIKGLIIGLCIWPLEFNVLNNISFVQAQNLREELRFQAEELRQEIRGDAPCADGSGESCSRETPSRPEHREPCGGCLPSVTPQPSPSIGPGPSIQPTPQPSSQPSPSSAPGVGGNGANQGEKSEGGANESSSITSGGVSAENSYQLKGLSFTSSR